MVKKRQNSAVLDMIQQKYPGYHPLMAIADIAHHPSNEVDMDLRFKCHAMIAKFVEPELKSVQTINGDNIPHVTISMFGDNDGEEPEVLDFSELPPNTLTVK